MSADSNHMILTRDRNDIFGQKWEHYYSGFLANLQFQAVAFLVCLNIDTSFIIFPSGLKGDLGFPSVDFLLFDALIEPPRKGAEALF